MTDDKDFVATHEDVVNTVLAPIRARLIDNYRIIEYLEKQNKKMRNCANCKKFSDCYNFSVSEGLDFDVTSQCSKWECKE